MSSGIGAIEQLGQPCLPFESPDPDTSLMDDLTKNLTDGRSFEERVFARFDAMDASFNSMERRFEAINSRFDTTERRFEAINSRFDTIDRRFEIIEHRLDVIENRLDAIDNRLDGVERRLTTLEANAERYALDTKPLWERALAEILDVGQKVTVLQQTVTSMQEDIVIIDRKLDVLAKDVLHVRAHQVRNEERLKRLESPDT